ncbi:ribonuclease T2 family protein [Tsuneonella sp. HG222]
MIGIRLFAAALLAMPAALSAQAYQCQVPQGQIAVPRMDRGAERRAPVTGYTLAVSWSPEYCRTRKGSKADARQCSGAGGRFGMVLHGLWPEGARVSPQWCRTEVPLRGDALRPHLCMTPSARLLAHEWARHGSCMVRRPVAYFKVGSILWNSLRWPDIDRLSRREPTAGDLRQAFVTANPAWGADQVGVEVNERGWFEGMRLCYGTDFMPRTCKRSALGPADAQPIKIWRGL